MSLTFGKEFDHGTVNTNVQDQRVNGQSRRVKCRDNSVGISSKKTL